MYAAAKFGIADHLADGSRTAAEIAAAVGCDARALHRFLRTLANFEIVTMNDDGRFTLTPLGDALKSNAPGFARSAVLTMGGPVGWKSWEHIEYSLRTGLPAGGDIYLLSHIIHDWNDAQSLTIFGNLRQAMTPASRLLLIELVLRDRGAPGFGSADMSMMILTGGAERTVREYEALLARADLKMTRVVPTTTSPSIVEATVA